MSKRQEILKALGLEQVRLAASLLTAMWSSHGRLCTCVDCHAARQKLVDAVGALK